MHQGMYNVKVILPIYHQNVNLVGMEMRAKRSAVSTVLVKITLVITRLDTVPINGVIQDGSGGNVPKVRSCWGN